MSTTARASRLPAGITRVGSRLRRREPSGSVLVTYDVFETVLVRAVSPPHAVFEEVGRRASEQKLIGCSPQAFAQARWRAAARAGRAHRDTMVLEHVYAELGAALGLREEIRRELVELELAVEAALLRPVPHMLTQLAAERAAAGRVVYVSDMYLPAAFIQEQLERHGCWEPGDVLYVSHSHGRTKRSGELFRVVAEAEGVPVSAIRHHGNDQNADIRGAQRAGAQPVLLPEANPNRYEQRLQRHRGGTDGLTAAMAGASRLARLAMAPQTPRERALVEVAAGVMAPVLTAYVVWLLRRASDEGLRRLYFVARDGQVLLRIAERVAPKLGLDLELRYLHASRLVWNRAVASPTHHPQAWHSLIGLSNDGIANRDILERTGIGADALERVMAESGDPADAWRSTTDRTPLRRALEQIVADGTLAAAAVDNKRVVVRYLQEQGLFDDVPHGFVDVGWRGTQHDVLAELQSERAVAPAHGFFFGLDHSTSTWGHLREAYLFDSRRATNPAGSTGSTGSTDAIDSALRSMGGSYPAQAITRRGTPAGQAAFTLVEVFCSGDHGTLSDYEETPDGVRPVLSAGREEAVAAWGLPLVWRTVDAYVDHLGIDTARPYLHVDLHQALIDVMTLFWDQPTRVEAAVWSSFPWEVGQGSRQRIVELARPYRLDRVVTEVAGARSLQELKQGVRTAQRTEWLAASLLQGSFTAGVVLRPRSVLRQTLTRAEDGLRRQVGRHPRLRRIIRGGG